MSEPRTAAGRRFLANPTAPLEQWIIAIEQESAADQHFLEERRNEQWGAEAAPALDVERLARALHQASHGQDGAAGRLADGNRFAHSYDACKHPDHWLSKARRAAAAYAAGEGDLE